MKRLLLISMLLISLTVCNAQRITYNDLKYAITHDLDQVEDHFSKKGFSYGGVDTFGVDRNHYSYSLIKKGKTHKADLYIGKEAVNGTFCKSSLYTTFQSDYLLLKTDIKRNGFKFIETRTHSNGSLINVYNKGIYNIEIWLRRNKEFEFTEYNIWLINENQLSN